MTSVQDYILRRDSTLQGPSKLWQPRFNGAL